MFLPITINDIITPSSIDNCFINYYIDNCFINYHLDNSQRISACLIVAG